MIASIEGGAPVPPHWIPNPLTGDEHPTGSGTLSRREIPPLRLFRFAVAEFDGMDKPDSTGVLVGIPNRPHRRADRFGRKIHPCVLRVDCATRADWEQEIEGNCFPRLVSAWLRSGLPE